MHGARITHQHCDRQSEQEKTGGHEVSVAPEELADLLVVVAAHRRATEARGGPQRGWKGEGMEGKSTRVCE